MSTSRAARSVTVIPVISGQFAHRPLNSANKKRVAAYARVSTDTEEQLTSYDAQVDHYTRNIQENNEWKFVGMYTDEGISGTSTKNREGFKRMIADAMNGKIDLILTKSISRFARNTVDTLTAVRQLKGKGVEVYFEKENIYTFDNKGELFITIMSSLAQEESRSISENVTWGQRKRFADGKVTMPYKRFLGYQRGEDGQPQIVEEEAVIVRRIYKMFMDGKPPSAIAKYLTTEDIPTPGGKKKWQPGVVESILTNEKYKGDAILQKNFTVDFLTKKQKVNRGEVPQYYVENSHPAIVSAQVFDLAQHEVQRRKGMRYTSSVGFFSSRIICGDCGSIYGQKLWHSTDKYRCTVWRCNRKYEKDKQKCTTPHLKEDQIKSVFMEAFNSIISNKEEILSTFSNYFNKSTSTKSQEATCKRIEEECISIESEVNKLVSENALRLQNQGEYNAKYNGLVQRHEELEKKRQELTEEVQRRKAKRSEMREYIQALKKQQALLTEFDESLWIATIEKMVVYSIDRVVFHFKDGTELAWGMASGI